MKTLRKIIEIDKERCDGCGNCVPSCAEGAIRIIDGKAEVVDDKFCDGLGACLGECPQDALKLVEREVEEFDEEAVEQHLENMKKQEEKNKQEKPLACGCPSTKLETFSQSSACQCANEPATVESRQHSALSHWPVQIRLVPPDAPFLKGADLLVAADCVPFAYANFHSDFLAGKTLMVGCPKFDNAESYINKFTEIFKTAGIKSVTVAIMEVPCCSGLPAIIDKAMKRAGADIPVREAVISARGERIQ
ncbi:MAG: 4Fe-4S binding protein [Desulfarculaceae bacterium]|nr:4Fe-4S binding protein [Desulfarculaceae bacterium]